MFSAMLLYLVSLKKDWLRVYLISGKIRFCNTTSRYSHQNWIWPLLTPCTCLCLPYFHSKSINCLCLHLDPFPAAWIHPMMLRLMLGESSWSGLIQSLQWLETSCLLNQPKSASGLWCKSPAWTETTSLWLLVWQMWYLRFQVGICI